MKPVFDLKGYNILPEDILVELEKFSNPDNLDCNLEKNEFPFEVFPEHIQKIIKETNENLNFPIDFICASILFALSVGIGNTHKAEVKTEWRENALLYIAIVGHAGTNKSHPLSFALSPILEHDKSTSEQYDNEKKIYDKELNRPKKDRNTQWEEDLKKPIWKKLLLSDFTPEALAEVHKFNKRGIGVYVDELTGWIKNFNRYNTGSEMEFWLSGWSGKPINIDRKSGEPVFIPQPFIPVCGTIQNGLLNELAKNSRTQNGFIDRILFVMPENLQKSYWSDSEINPQIKEDWNSIVNKLLFMPIDFDNSMNPIPQVLRFSTEAREILFEWQKENTDQINNSQSGSLKGILSKMEMYAIRFALILEMSKFACGESDKKAIGKESVEGAIKLVNYFKKSAVKVNAIITNLNPVEKLSLLQQNVYKALPVNFKTSEGVKIATSLEMPERSFKRFLYEREFFDRISQGTYEKKI